jgi:large subunit ribosomal protein L7Ae
MASKASKGKKVAPAPKSDSQKKKAQAKTFVNEHPHLFVKDAKDFRIGRDVRKRDVSRFVKWPQYIRIQRQRAILHQRLKVPPAINQFTATLDKNGAKNVLGLLNKYKPETKQEKAARRKKAAEAEVKMSDKSEEKKPKTLKYGLSHITKLVEEKRARLVVIAHDVDPIELVLWLPALCRKMEVPYCIIKGKARLGHLVHKKTATAVALTDVKKEDQAKLDQVVQSVKLAFNDNANSRKNWGGGVMGAKAQEIQKQRVRAMARAQATKDKKL